MVVLEILLNHNELDGPALVARSGQRLERRTIAAVLRRMQSKKLVASRPEAARMAGRSARRLFHITAPGRRLFELWTMLRRQLRRIPA
jgi:hypothetical protein